MRVKICGLTRPDDAALAAALGATDLGCVLAPDSPRALSAARAREVFAEIPASVHRVLVFRSPDVEDVLRATDATGVADVQLHRSEETVATALEARGLTVRRAYDATRGLDAADLARPDRPVLLDVGGGGSGRRFDWSALDGRSLAHVWIAGGITPENVAALLRLGPAGIDVSSGVERAPGRKSPERMRALFAALRGRRGPVPGVPAR